MACICVVHVRRRQKARLLQKMHKRREEQGTKALQEKLAAYKALRIQEVQRQRVDMVAGNHASWVLTPAWWVPQVPEAEKARLREKMLKRRQEQDAKALQDKLAAAEAEWREAERREAGVSLHSPS